MKTISNRLFIENISMDVRSILKETEVLKSLSVDQLNKQPSNNGWSIGQCLQHMNVYSRHYIPAIETALTRAKSEESGKFSSGWLGGYFANLMKTDSNGIVKSKMKSPKNAEPSVVPDSGAELIEFISHQHHLLNILDIAQNVNLGNERVPTSLSRFIRLKIGDTFSFFVEHEKRHMAQIGRIMK
jgi:uncharacterized damage-inducible protein DinB